MNEDKEDLQAAAPRTASLWRDCVLDATMGARDGLFTFCPVEFDADGSISAVVTGMNYISARPPEHMRFFGVVHVDGQEAADRFCEEHAEALSAFSSSPAADGPKAPEGPQKEELKP